MTRRIAADELAAGNREDELTAIVALIRTKLLPAAQLPHILDSVGSAVVLARLSTEDELPSVPGVGMDLVGAVTPEGIADARREVQQWLRQGYRVVSVLDPDYPTNLRDIFNRPALLFTEGSWLDRVDSHSIAVVGTREASDLGIRRARKLSKELVEAGFTILSGMALGVDTAAHTAALEAGGRTVAVMGTGLAQRYPAQNAELSVAIAEHGALVSQFFPRQRPARWTFPMRNVVMSGLSLATVVVEASSSSGARMQARIALQHGRTVFLLKSLVEKHQWAWDYVHEGRYGVNAVQIESTAEITSRVNGNVQLESIADR